MVVIRQIVTLVLVLLIKIGDSVIYLITAVYAWILQQSNVLQSKIFSLKVPKKSRKKTKIKKSKTLYKTSSLPKRTRFLLSLPHKGQRELLRLNALMKKSVVSFIRLISNTVTRVVQGTFRSLLKLKTLLPKRKKKRGRKKKAPIYKPSFFYKIKFFALGVIMSFVFLFVPLLFVLFVSELPDPSSLSVSSIPKTTKIYDRNGALLYEIYVNQNRTVVKLDQIPKDLKQATIAIEDKDFYTHPGFDLRGILRALVTNIRTDNLQGGSTITQQLIKSAFLTPEPSIKRKVKEVTLAFWSERKYTKDQILEMYFNYVPYGGTAWGVESASEIYFGKKVGDLTLAESAFLAGLPRAPSIYSPFSGEGDLWKKRQKDVLSAMVRDGYITQKQANEAFSQELAFNSPKVPIKAPHFVMYVKDLLVQKYGISEVERGGLHVRTSLDLKLQEKVERTVADHVDENAYLNVQNGAALITDPKNGDVLAMVGSRDYFDTENDGNVNVATSLRQPGSTVKIVTYTLALQNGYTEATLIDDTPLTIASSDGGPSYTPVNYDGTYHGKQTLRNSFANSYNIPAVRVAQKFGASKVAEMGRKMGITTWDNPHRYGLSITLGGGETRMTDLSAVYGTIANGGKRTDLNPVLEVNDAYGNRVYSKQVQAQQVVDEGVAYIIEDILADNTARSAAFGPNSPLHIPGYRVSVKTGTTDNKRDNWTVGFTNDYVIATWVGNNDNTPMSPELTSGITGAAPMWHDLMRMALENKKPDAANVPSSVVAKNCFGKTTLFLRGTENTINCRFSPAFVSPTPAIQ